MTEALPCAGNEFDEITSLQTILATPNYAESGCIVEI